MDKMLDGQAVAEDQTLDSRLLALALEVGAGIVMITDELGSIQYVNRSFELQTGYRRDEVIGRLPGILKSGLQGRDFYQQLWSTLKKGESFSDVLINRRKDGSIYYEEKTITPITLEDGVSKYISIGRDITDQILEQRRLRRFVSYDPVTELPNRYLFSERLNQTIKRLERADENALALVFLNLHRFRRINETLGYEAGDLVLRMVGQRLQNILQDSPSLCRISGDSFAFYVEGEQVPLIDRLLTDIIAVFRQPIECCEEKIFLNVSIGVSLYPDDGEAEQLIKHAEIAMVKSRGQGVDQFQFYTSDLNSHAKQKLTLEAELRRAVENQEFVLHYQPQVGLEHGDLVGVEALVRWQHPERGLVYPGEFIELLEETGMIFQVSNWIIDQACKDFSAITAAGQTCHRIAINLSALQFKDAQLPFTIEAALSRSGIVAENLEFEITEGIMMTNINHVLNILNSLSDMGLRLSIDDFGTGFSSMNYLRSFPVHALKLALPFVQGLPHEPGDVGITRAVIALAHNLGLDVVAEGVEAQNQLEFLRKEQCDYFQGFLYSRAVPLQQLIALLETGKKL